MPRGPNRSTTRADVLAVMVERATSREPWTSKEIGEAVGCSRDIAYNRLRELEQLGKIHTKKVSSRGRVWWVAESALAEAEAGADASA